MTIFFYNTIFIIFSIIYLPTLILKGKLHKDFFQRFGIFGRETLARLSSLKRTVWIHAVSVGEVRAASPLIEFIEKELPGHSIVITTTTRTGNTLARSIFKARALVIYYPLDLSFITGRFVELIRPSVFAAMETEIWPNLIMSLSRRGVPAIILNGRISDRSFAGYRAASGFFKPLLRRITVFCMQSEADAERIKIIGAPVERVVITGNMKFDTGTAVYRGASFPGEGDRARLKVRYSMYPDEEVIIAGSTHPGEEEIIVAVYLRLLAGFPGLRLIIAPRHIERAADIERLLEKSGLRSARISRFEDSGFHSHARPVLILDTIGQLKDLYAIATIVFIGGSLVRKGGHNLVEPALFGKPILCGPCMSNFRDMVSQFERYHAVLIVEDEASLEKAMRKLLGSAQERAFLGDNARRLIETQSGASVRNLLVLQKVLEENAAQAHEGLFAVT